MHKKIGIIGGLSPESTASYYLHIVHSYVKKFGDNGYPEIIIYSVNLSKYHKWRDDGRWDLVVQGLSEAANSLQKAGAEFGLIATNTMHKVFDEVQRGTSLPLLNIIDVVALYVEQKSIKTVGLLGTSFTMSEDFYKLGLKKYGIDVIAPDPKEQKSVHSVIIDELICGEIREQSKRKFLDIIDHLHDRGAEGVILGCTEIPLLVRQEECRVMLFDTAAIHARAALLQAI